MIPSTRPRVLVVDDDAGVARGLRRLLHSVADVTVEQVPAAALRRLQRGERFDVVLCDVMMPDMSGPELFEHVMASVPELGPAFVFLTGGVREDVEGPLRATGRPCLEKPVAFGAVLEVLEQLTAKVA